MAKNKDAIAAAIKNAAPFTKKGKGFLPEGCPVTCLGTKEGMYFYITPLGQLRCLKDKDHGGKQILSLFENESSFVSKGKYARVNQKGDVTGWCTDDVARDLMATCAQEGIWEPAEKVRGAGAWPNPDGNGIVMHCGDIIYSNSGEFKPGVCGSFVYPSEPPRQKPALKPASSAEVDELLNLFKTWNWGRPDLDPYLLLGWIGAAIIGGALKWRPLMWITGDKGTGKSTLQDVIAHIFNGALLAVSDPTPAGIWQRTRYSSLPVALDEIEPDDDPRKAQAVIKLARQACSGGVVLRGSSEGTASEFKAVNCYLFSSILIPPLLSQDRSRMAILELGAIGGNAKDSGFVKIPHIDKKRLSDIGAGILRRMIDNYNTLYENIEMLHIGFSRCGLDSRGCDQFGTLIAAADLLLSNGYAIERDSMEEWAEKLKPLIAQEKYENVADNVSCAEHLLTSFAEIYKDGKKRTIGDWIAEAAGMECSISSQNCDANNANKVIATYGLRVESLETSDGTGREMVLFIASNHQGLAKIYQNTRWQLGVWTQAFRRFEGAMNHNTKRFNGIASKCVYVPLKNLPLHISNEEALNIMACG